MQNFGIDCQGAASAAQHTPAGIYGRPGIRKVDGVTLDTVRCGADDSDCAFPNCGCPAKTKRAPDLLSAARAVVAMTFHEACNADRAMQPKLYCQCDVLNPCWDNRPNDVPGKHWAGGDACSHCNLRAAIAKAGSASS